MEETEYKPNNSGTPVFESRNIHSTKSKDEQNPFVRVKKEKVRKSRGVERTNFVPANIPSPCES